MIPRFSANHSPSSGSSTIPEITAEGTAIRLIYRLKTAAIKKFQTELATDPDLRPLTLDRRNSPYLNAVIARKNRDSRIRSLAGWRQSHDFFWQ